MKIINSFFVFSLYSEYNVKYPESSKETICKMIDDIVNFVVDTDTILVADLPVGRFYNNDKSKYTMFDIGAPKTFNNLDFLKNIVNIENEIIIIYSFNITEDLLYEIRYTTLKNFE